MQAVEMERTAAEDLTTMFDDDEIAHILAELRAGTRQKGTIGGVIRDQVVDRLDIWQLSLACAQPPLLSSRESFAWRQQGLRSRGPVRFRLQHRGFREQTSTRERYRYPD